MPAAETNRSGSGQSWSFQSENDSPDPVQGLNQGSRTVYMFCTYTAFGQRNEKTTQEIIAQRYTFQGRESAANAAAGAPMYYRFRFYAPPIGLMLNRNPWGYAHSRYSLYDAMEQNPVMVTEPFSFTGSTAGPSPLPPDVMLGERQAMAMDIQDARSSRDERGVWTKDVTNLPAKRGSFELISERVEGHPHGSVEAHEADTGKLKKIYRIDAEGKKTEPGIDIQFAVVRSPASLIISESVNIDKKKKWKGWWLQVSTGDCWKLSLHNICCESNLFEVTVQVKQGQYVKYGKSTTLDGWQYVRIGETILLPERAVVDITWDRLQVPEGVMGLTAASATLDIGVSCVPGDDRSRG